MWLFCPACGPVSWCWVFTIIFHLWSWSWSHYTNVFLGVHSFLSLTVNVGSSAQVSSFKLQVYCSAIKDSRQEEVLLISKKSYYGKEAQGKPLGWIKK